MGAPAQGHPPEPGGNQDAAEAAAALPAQAEIFSDDHIAQAIARSVDLFGEA